MTSCPVSGYEIHVGDTTGRDRERPLLNIDGLADGLEAALDIDRLFMTAQKPGWSP